ncbi:MAG: hypothetical protein ACPG4U_08575 [Pseudomonadales bacterium]
MANLLFITALPQEQDALLTALALPAVQCVVSRPLSLTLHSLSRGEDCIYITQSGMGNVNAGAKLALILERYSIDQIVLIGVGGALCSALEIGEMVISDRVIQHDYFSSLEDGNFLMRPGDLHLSSEQSLGYDPVLQSPVHKIDLHQLCTQSQGMYQALIASGCEFVGTAARKRAIHQKCLGARLVDMEASAVAAVAQQYAVPFIVAKTVSDKLNSDGSIGQDFEHFLHSACRNAAQFGQDIAAHFFERP